MASLSVSPLISAAAMSSPSRYPLSFSHCSSAQSALLFSPLSAGQMRLHNRCNSRQILRRLPSVKAEIKYVDGVEAKKLVTEEGYTVLDIRDRTQYEKAHIVPCTHIPLYVENTDNDVGTVVNRTLHNNFSGLLYGLAYTKINPDFVSSVEKKFTKDSKLLLVCQEGLRSGSAADKLEQAGFQNLAYISLGLQKVSPGIFDKEGPKELQDAGKGGLVTIQGKISTVLGSVLVAALLFVTFFPDQAEQWFFTK